MKVTVAVLQASATNYPTSAYIQSLSRCSDSAYLAPMRMQSGMFVGLMEVLFLAFDRESAVCFKVV